MVIVLVVIGALLSGCATPLLIGEYVIKERAQYYRAIHDAR